MSLQSVFGEIESVQFDVGLSILSGFSVVMRVLEEDEIAKALITVLHTTADNRQRTLDRLLELVKADQASQYMHRHDSAITAYLYALNHVDNQLAQKAIDGILQAPNLFWARRLANHIREQAAIP